MRRRSGFQRFKDTIAFPLRALLLPEKDRWGLSSWATERFDYVAREVRGYCLDVGCGVGNRFVIEFLGGHGKGIDAFPYEGLTAEQVVKDMSRFPFADQLFDSVVFIANINHVPAALRSIELRESYRVLKPSGNIIITMGNPWLEVAAHQMLHLHEKFFGERNVYHEHGVEEEEIYYLKDKEILKLLRQAGFIDIRKKYFWTQWGLNHLFIGDKQKI